MTTSNITDAAYVGPVPPRPDATVGDHRGSWVPNGAMISTRFMELRKRRGLMIALILVTIGIPTVFLAIRLLLHAFAPHTYGPAGGYAIYSALVSGVLYIFGFIVAATLGATPRQFWRYVGLPVLWPNLLGTLSLLFANAFGAIATAYALTGSSLNIVPILLYAQIRGDVLNNPGLGAALALGMIVITALANVVYLVIRTRAERWLK